MCSDRLTMNGWPQLNTPLCYLMRVGGTSEWRKQVFVKRKARFIWVIWAAGRLSQNSSHTSDADQAFGRVISLVILQKPVINQSRWWILEEYSTASARRSFDEHAANCTADVCMVYWPIQSFGWWSRDAGFWCWNWPVVSRSVQLTVAFLSHLRIVAIGAQCKNTGHSVLKPATDILRRQMAVTSRERYLVEPLDKTRLKSAITERTASFVLGFIVSMDIFLRH